MIKGQVEAWGLFCSYTSQGCVGGFAVHMVHGPPHVDVNGAKGGGGGTRKNNTGITSTAPHVYLTARLSHGEICPEQIRAEDSCLKVCLSAARHLF